MGMQLIFCVEADAVCKSDFIYIKQVISNFYTVDQANVKITPVYMDGRGNYASQKINRIVKKWIKDYAVGNKKGKSHVIYCFDCDSYDSKPEDQIFLAHAEKFCKDNGFEFVWFCRDIEHVFLGRQISQNLKKKEAESFAKKCLITGIGVQTLRCNRFQDRKSNLCCVLDKYL